MPKIALLLRLLAAIDEARSDFEALKARVDDEHPPSTRTLRRYLAELSLAGFPWYYDRNSDTYRFADDYSLRRLELSGNEVFGLLALRGIASSLGGNIGASIDEVTEKIAQLTQGKTRAATARPSVRLQLPNVDLDAERSAAFDLLQRAQRERQSMRFAYVDKTGARTKRHVDPYGFVVSGGRVYLIAHDRTRGAKRVFALDNVSEAQLAPQRFSMPADFDVEAFAARSVSGIMYADTSVTITVAYSPVVSRAAKADRVVRERTIVERDDGSVEIAYTVSDAAEFVRWSLKWGAEAEIVAPPDVRAVATDVARAIVRRYERAIEPEAALAARTIG